jgi:hypothetical protein
MIAAYRAANAVAALVSPVVVSNAPLGLTRVVRSIRSSTLSARSVAGSIALLPPSITKSGFNGQLLFAQINEVVLEGLNRPGSAMGCQPSYPVDWILAFSV